MSIVLVAGFAVAMSACGARSSLPVPPIIDANSIITYASFGNLNANDPSNPNSAKNIWVINAEANGFVSQPLTHLDVTGADSDEPVWSPDGSKIAFASVAALDRSDQLNTNSTENIWVIDATADNVQGFSLRPLTCLMTSGSESESPAWSPNGNMIAFASNRAPDGNDQLNTNSAENIWLVNANDPDCSSAHPLTRFTAIKGVSFSPVWSPDGKQIAFASNRDLFGKDQLNTNGIFNIWIVNTNDTNESSAHPLTRLTAAGADSFNPVWSPVLQDGTKIAFNSRRDLNNANDQLNTNGTANIWVINANDLNGSSAHPLTKLTASQASSLEPAWSPILPDGTTKIAFASSRDLNMSSNAGNVAYNIWVINANDTDGSSAHPLTKLTAAGADSENPAWSRDGSQITFASSRDLDINSNAANGTSNIWLINANDTNGSSAQPLTKRANGLSFSPSVR
jgi:Tol biopolymer transport system component